MEIQPGQYVSSTSVQSSSESLDGSQTVGDLVNALWIYFAKYQSTPPTDADMKELMQLVKDFNAHVTTTPNFDTDPKTYVLYQMINDLPIDGQHTLGYYAASTNAAAAITALEQNSSQYMLNQYVADAVNKWYGPNPALQQAANAGFEQALHLLYGDLGSYQLDPTNSDLAARIAADVRTVMQEAASLPKGPGQGTSVTDGYLVAAVDFIKANGLDQLANAVFNSQGSVIPANLQAFQMALGSTSTSASGNQGIPLYADLKSAVYWAGHQEYPDWG